MVIERGFKSFWWDFWGEGRKEVAVCDKTEEKIDRSWRGIELSCI